MGYEREIGTISNCKESLSIKEYTIGGNYGYK